MIDQLVQVRSDKHTGTQRGLWVRLFNLTQPIAVAACAVLLVTLKVPHPTIHAAAPQAGNRAPKDDAETWSDVQQWMQKNCVNRWTFYNRKLADRPGQQQQAKKLMTEQYQRVAGAKDPEMRKALTLQATYRDNIFGIVLDFRKGSMNRPQAQQQIEKWESKLADIEVYLRKVRISELQNEINDLQQRRSEYVSRVASRDLNQADLPPVRISPGTGEAAPLLEETDNSPARHSDATSRPAANH